MSLCPLYQSSNRSVCSSEESRWPLLPCCPFAFNFKIRAACLLRSFAIEDRNEFMKTAIAASCSPNAASTPPSTLTSSCCCDSRIPLISRICCRESFSHMHPSKLECISVRKFAKKNFKHWFPRTYVCTVCTVCMYVCMYVCMCAYVCMYVCTVCIYVRTYVYICMYRWIFFLLP